MNNQTINILKCDICDALARNINDNFISVSFIFSENEKSVYIRFILKELTEKEEEYIDDCSAEIEASQPFIIINIESFTDASTRLLPHIVYRRKTNQT